MFNSERQRIPIKFRHKEETVPQSLFCLCLKYLARDLDSICSKKAEGYTLHNGLALPSEICEPFIETYLNNGGEIFDNFTHLFEDVTKTNLRSINISDSSISDNGLEKLLRHNLYEITLTDCQNLTQITYLNIFKYAVNLRSLIIGPNVQIIPFSKASNYAVPLDGDMCVMLSKKAPNLKHLALRGFENSLFTSDNIFLSDILDKHLSLRVLDLSCCLNVGDLSNLCQLSNLHTLILFDVPNLQDNNALLNICLAKSLVVLDLSHSISDPNQGVYRNENYTLASIVRCLPNLMSLDISGTNLAGLLDHHVKYFDICVSVIVTVKGTREHFLEESLSGKRSDIPGLEFRVDNPLEFLGLYHTLYKACERHNIPAKIISGDANEEQLFNAAASCMNKPKLLESILQDLYKLFTGDQCTQIDQGLDIVLEALTRHIKEKLIQKLGCYLLFYVVKMSNHPLLINDNSVKRRSIITALLTGMIYYKYDELMLRNGCLTLWELRSFQDLLFEFNRLVQILLHILTTNDEEGSFQRIGVHLLSSVCNLINNNQRNELGDAGTIEIMIKIVKDRLHRRVCDDVLEVVWLIMWNLTDEAPKNCKRFLDGCGMKYFLECLKFFPDNIELMNSMMGSLSNVAEVKELRPKLMKANFIKMFSKILFSTQDRFMISYNAAGIIANLASDGQKSWVIKSPSRSKVLERMTKAIQNWNLDAERDVNYNSLKSLLQLVQVYHTPQCQHWAAWTLANLTLVNPEDYCSMTIAEGGLRIMSELLDQYPVSNQNNIHGVIYGLAQIVINQCSMYIKNSVVKSSQ